MKYECTVNLDQVLRDHIDAIAAGDWPLAKRIAKATEDLASRIDRPCLGCKTGGRCKVSR